MSENAIDSENTSKPATDAAKPKGMRKLAKKAKVREEGGQRQEAGRQAQGGP
jgi:hypothetical protein